jgi:hypothetical protein
MHARDAAADGALARAQISRGLPGPPLLDRTLTPGHA